MTDQQLAIVEEYKRLLGKSRRTKTEKQRLSELENALRDVYPAQYALYWWSIDTNHTGNGTAGFSREAAQGIADKCNRESLDDPHAIGIVHWVQPVGTPHRMEKPA